MQTYYPRRRTLRLPDYDYSAPGAYYVTIGTHTRELTFADNTLRKIVERTWRTVIDPAACLEAGDYVVMPNHVHGIIWIHEGDPHSRSLRRIVASFKGTSTTRVNRERRTPGGIVWQENYYEHVIRNEADLERVRQYILENPLKRELEEDHPENGPFDLVPMR